MNPFVTADLYLPVLHPSSKYIWALHHKSMLSVVSDENMLYIQIHMYFFKHYNHFAEPLQPLDVALSPYHADIGQQITSPVACHNIYPATHRNVFQTVQQALSFSSGQGIHADFAKLNDKINSPSASYILKLANRLYGESTANFLPVGL